MIGAIIGDIIGSTYEFDRTKDKNFEMYTRHSHFTDDTVLTIATADVLMNGGDYAETYRAYAKWYPAVGYGKKFAEWAIGDDPAPYNSWGNGSAMRVSPVAFAFNSLDDVLNEAKKSAEVTHNHPEGIKGAQAAACVTYLARKKKDKAFIRTYIQDLFDYDLKRTCDEIRPTYKFEVSCAKSVPESIICFLEAESFEETIRLCVSMGGDADTMAAIAGPMAQVYYDDIDPDHIAKMAKYLEPDMFKTVFDFINWCSEKK